MEMEFPEYDEFKPQVWIRAVSQSLIPQIDSLVLDVDGVILDVAASFRVAISETVQYFFTNVLKFKGSTLLITPDETQLFKLAGRFNNDWELTYGVCLFYLGEAFEKSTENVDALREESKELSEFTAEVKERGGGLKSVLKLTFEHLDVEQQAKIQKVWDRKLIKQVFQEIYAGLEYCEKFYGYKPEFLKREGLLNQEKVIVNKVLVERFYPNVAVLTGRTKEETDFALEKTGLAPLISRSLLEYDDGGATKPDPQVLVKLSEEMETKVGIYVGDTVDDVETVKNFGRLHFQTEFLSGVVLHRPEEQSIFTNKEVDIIATSTNDLLSALISLKSTQG